MSKEKTWSGTWCLEAEREERNHISLDCDYLLPPPKCPRDLQVPWTSSSPVIVPLSLHRISISPILMKILGVVGQPGMLCCTHLWVFVFFARDRTQLVFSSPAELHPRPLGSFSILTCMVSREPYERSSDWLLSLD